MTLGYGPPRAKCPLCAEEGAISLDQSVHKCRHPRGAEMLRGSFRFECSNQHIWLTPIEDARLMGAFLGRQEAAS